jgi:hypothetical protein
MTLDPNNLSAPPIDTGLVPPDDAHPSSFGQDACGRVYVAAIENTQQVYRLQESNGGACAMRSVNVTVTGSGQVTGPGIDCPGDCTAEVYDGQRLTLTQTADPEGGFVGWSGACTGIGDCALRMINGNANVVAEFEDLPPPPPPPPPPPVVKQLTVLKLEAAKGKVKKGKRASLTVSASGCDGRPGDSIALLKGDAQVGTAALDASCRADFHPKVKRATTYTATIGEDDLNLAAMSNAVKVKVKPKRR